MSGFCAQEELDIDEASIAPNPRVTQASGVISSRFRAS